METCKGCHGTGTIQLFTSSKPCVKCGGTGKAGGCCADFNGTYTVTFGGITNCDLPAKGTPYPATDFGKLDVSNWAVAGLVFNDDGSVDASKAEVIVFYE